MSIYDDDDGMDEVEECSECGHLHFNTERNEYDECPLLSEGCTCPFRDGTGEYDARHHTHECRECGSLRSTLKTRQTLIDEAYDALTEATDIMDPGEFNDAVEMVRGMLAAFRS